MKKKILFVIDSLNCAGAEKSLVTLLSHLNNEMYEIDLQLFSYGGILEKCLSDKINILPPLAYTTFSQLSLLDAIRTMNYKMIKSRLYYSIKIRMKKYSHTEEAKIFWECVESNFYNYSKLYDIAISYGQGIPTFYVADKITAKDKYAWVNESFTPKEREKNFQRSFYDKYKKIVTVSQSAKEVFDYQFPEYKHKTKIIFDIQDYSLISMMSKAPKSFLDSFEGLRILTIGRLDPIKGYDIAIEACKILKNYRINFKWYSLGVGPLETELKKIITEYDLEDDFIFLGVTPNPYPFIKDCDIYVQTSRSEGFGLAISEARMLNKPVVTTRFDSVFNQMIHEKNGLVVDMNGESVAEGILRLINDDELRNNIISYLETEKKGNIEELEKFYELIR